MVSSRRKVSSTESSASDLHERPCSSFELRVISFSS